MRNATSLAEKLRARRGTLLAVGALILLYFLSLGSVPLLEPDEGRYTEIPREMLQRGDWVLPHLNGVRYFEKPPLYYWLNAASIKLFGLNPFASRFWSATFALLGLLVVYLLVKRTLAERTARLSVAILATSPLYLALARLTIIDMTVSFFITVTLVCFFLAQDEQEDRSRARWFWYGMFIAAALAVLSKGLIGIVLPGGVIGLYILLTRQWKILAHVPWISGSGLFLVIALPWHILAALRDQGFLWFYFVHEHFLRFLTPISDRHEPFWFFLPVIAWALLPWTAFIPSAMMSFWKVSRPRRILIFDPGLPLFLWLWAGVILVFFSASNSKLIPYILPAIPPLAVLAAVEVDRLLAQKKYPGRAIMVLVSISILAMILFGTAFLAAGMGVVAAFSPPGELFPMVIVSAAATITLCCYALGLAVRGRWPRAVAAMVLCACALFACIWSAAPVIERGRSTRRMANFLKANMKPGDRLMAYRYYPQTLPVYMGRTIAVAAFTGEQTYGVSRLSKAEREERFPDAKAFKALWDSPARVYCVMDNDSEKYLQRDGIDHLYPIIKERQVLLATNQPWDSGEGR
jgi:4-amino-4-deoxy-L-arabinose transferase-like glycosyltransferase